MRPEWRLATASLRQRPSRSLLLVGAVALSAALMVAVACIVGSANDAVRAQLEAQLGDADLTIAPPARGELLAPEAVAVAQAWPEVQRVLPRVERALTLRYEATLARGNPPEPVEQSITTEVIAVAAPPADLRLELVAGRLPERENEIVLNRLAADSLTPSAVLRTRTGLRRSTPPSQAAGYLERDPPDLDTNTAAEYNAAVGPRPGQQLTLVRFGRAARQLTVVGVVEPPPLGGRPFAFIHPADPLAAEAGGYTQVDLILRGGVDAERVLEQRRPELADALGPAFRFSPTARTGADVEQNLAAGRIGFIITLMMCFLSAAFIISTGLNITLAEQMRSLAIVRSVGGTRKQLVVTQLIGGAMLGLLGGIVGLPFGVGVAVAVLAVLQEFVAIPLRVPWELLALAAAAAFSCGVGAAAVPALRAARLSPLAALRPRSQAPRGLRTAALGVVGLLLVLLQIALALAPGMFLPPAAAGQWMFWGYALVGLPSMFVGYFLLTAPAVVLLAPLLSPPLAKLLALPAPLLRRSVGSTPLRYAFTAGAMMTGFALFISLWMNGGGFLRDYLERTQFPDAFALGLRLTPEAQEQVEQLPFVSETCAISMQPVRPVGDASFGVRGLHRYQTNFIAFEPRPFFEMTSVTWYEGDPETAIPALEAGGAVIIAREFQAANGLSVGDNFVCEIADPVSGEPKQLEFEIVGVVDSPGLEIASRFFTIGEQYVDQALHAVFGSRRDLREKFGSDAVQFIQIQFREDAGVEDPDAIEQLRNALAGYGVLDVGSGRMIKATITEFAEGTLLVFSVIAIVAMLIACLGVSNLIIASIQARSAEFGVLRAVGGERGVLVNLVIGEAIIVAVVALVVGSGLGWQAAWAGRTLQTALAGFETGAAIPLVPVAFACAAVVLLTLLSAVPAILRLNRLRPANLLRG